VLAVANAGEADAQPAPGAGQAARDPHAQSRPDGQRRNTKTRPALGKVPASRTPSSLSMRGSARASARDPWAAWDAPAHSVAGRVHVMSAGLDAPDATTDAASDATPDATPALDDSSSSDVPADSQAPDTDSHASPSSDSPDASIPNAPYPANEYDGAEQPQPAEPVRPLRPIFAVGLLFGGATPLNRSGEQIPDLASAGLSFGYIPGRFGVWLDVDHQANSYASHDTILAATSFAPRITPRLWTGVRTGFGVTQVTFRDPMFGGVTAKTFRIEAITEYVIAHNWALWVRPLTIDVIDAKALGGAITTYQFTGGVAYRFGERRHAPAGPPRPPEPPAPPPAPYPSLEGGR